MAALTEGTHDGGFIVSEGNGSISRESITVLLGQNLTAGTVLGRVVKDTDSVTAVPDAGNSGDGAMGTITISAGAKAGAYSLTIIEPTADAGAFQVEDPDGVNVGSGTVGAAFSGGGLAFTLADGATDFVAGDRITITVDPGSGKYVAFDQDGVDGSEIAAGILYGAVDATTADAAGIAIVRSAEVNGAELTWPSDIDAAEKTAAIAQLESLGIIVR